VILLAKYIYLLARDAKPGGPGGGEYISSNVSGCPGSASELVFRFRHLMDKARSGLHDSIVRSRGLINCKTGGSFFERMRNGG